jgi:hypothetical protein
MMAAGADVAAGEGEALGVAGAAQPPMVITSPVSPAIQTPPADDMARVIIKAMFSHTLIRPPKICPAERANL